MKRGLTAAPQTFRLQGAVLVFLVCPPPRPHPAPMPSKRQRQGEGHAALPSATPPLGPAAAWCGSCAQTLQGDTLPTSNTKGAVRGRGVVCGTCRPLGKALRTVLCSCLTGGVAVTRSADDGEHQSPSPPFLSFSPHLSFPLSSSLMSLSSVCPYAFPPSSLITSL